MEAMDHSRPVAEQVIYMFTHAQEEALVDWFRDNALFYDKTSPDYKNIRRGIGL